MRTETMRFARVPAALLSSLLVAGCSSNVTDTTSTDVSAQAQPSATPSRATNEEAARTEDERTPRDAVRSQSVLIISLDGFNPDILEGAAAMPTLTRLMREGAATLNARTAVERTTTLPNHASMLTGRRVMGAHGHQVTFNSDIGTDLQELNDQYVPSLFDVAHDAGLATGLYTVKSKFAMFERSWDSDSGAPDRTDADDGADKIDNYFLADREEVLARQAVATLARVDTGIHLLHIGAFDKAGHRSGFMSKPYLAQAARVDALLADLMTSLENDPDLLQGLTLLITADHGGNGKGHFDQGDVDNARIPLIAWGRGVAPGADLYALNPERADPGTGLVGYDGKQPIRTLDIAATTLDLLGLDPVRGMSPALLLR